MAKKWIDYNEGNMMDYQLKNNNVTYVVTANEVDEENFALIAKALEAFADITERKNMIDFEYDNAKALLEQMFNVAQSKGLKTIKSPYFTATYVPGTEDTIKKVLDEKAIEELLDELKDELGLVKESFYKDKVTKGKKESVRWSVK